MMQHNLLHRWAVTRTCYATLWATVALFSPIAFGQTGQLPMTLHDAVTRALDRHPNLHVFQLRQQRLQGLRQTAALRPEWRLEAEVENLAGTGELQGFDASEQTLALSSVIELGGKRAARVAVIDARTGLVDTERQVEALELASQVTQTFVEVLAARQHLQLTEDALELAETTLEVVRRRAKAGAAPEAEVLRAEAIKAQAQLAAAQVERELSVERVELAALLGTTEVNFGPLSGDLFQLPPADSFERLYARAQENPIIAAYTEEAQLREAELRLSQSRGSSDIQWRLGVRRVAKTGDTGLVASASLPLFAGKRSRGDVAAARAEYNQVSLRREEALLRLHARLYEAYAKRQQNIETVQALRDKVIPALKNALQITRRAYESGRYSYIDWIAAQRELLDARQTLIEAAASALSYGAVIEQYTAEPLLAAND
jgi:cobalt-zinc-cadmium efflux system outer membrane protein